MKFGDQVIYDEGGKKYAATIIGGRDLTGERPFVNLAFAKEVLDMHSKPQDLSGTGSWSKAIQNRHDVAHISVVTTPGPDGKPTPYAGGRWSVPAPAVAPATAAKPVASVGGTVPAKPGVSFAGKLVGTAKAPAKPAWEFKGGKWVKK